MPFLPDREDLKVAVVGSAMSARAAATLADYGHDVVGWIPTPGLPTSWRVIIAGSANPAWPT